MVRVCEIDPAAGNSISWRVESPVPGVVLIDASVIGVRAPAPLHWRIGLWDKPPLDLEIDPMTGRLQGLQFVLQDERVAVGDIPEIAEVVRGLPIFDVSEWPSDRYIDERREVSAVRARSDELILRVGQDPAASASRIPGQLVIGYGQDGGLTQIRLGPLDREEWEGIDALSVGG